MISVVEQLTHQVATRASRDALRVGHEVLTFGQLLHEVASLAKGLAGERDAFPEGSFLPILARQDMATYVGALALLETGVPFTLVDPSTPTARLNELLPLASASSVVEASDLGKPAFLSRIFTGSVHAGATKILNSTGERPLLGLASSGTTGVPKMVVLGAGAVRSRLLPNFPAIADGSSIQCANSFSPLHFGGGFWRLGEVMAGTTLQVMTFRDLGLSQTIASLADGKVDLVRLPTNVLRLLAVHAPSEAFLPSAKILKVGVGEGALAKDVSAVQRLFSDDVLIWHSLSATEAGEYLRWTGGKGELGFPDQLPVGRPVEGRPVEIRRYRGFPPNGGEVFVGGEGIALGYISARDISSRFELKADGGRVWRSGDLVVSKPGRLFFHHSRADDVVKILGRFVALADVDRVSRKYVGVTDSLTIARNDGGVTRLETHIEMSGQTSVASREIRAHLRDHLPPHMIPARIIIHAKMPRTVRGKIDRRALAS